MGGSVGCQPRHCWCTEHLLSSASVFVCPLGWAAKSMSWIMLIFGVGTKCFGAECIPYVFTPESFLRRDLRCFLLCAYIELSLPGFRFLFFLNTYADCFQCVLIETGDICIHSIGDDGDLTDT